MTMCMMEEQETVGQPARGGAGRRRTEEEDGGGRRETNEDEVRTVWLHTKGLG